MNKKRPEAMQIGVLSLQATFVTRLCGERLVVYFKAERIVLQGAYTIKQKIEWRRRRTMTRTQTNSGNTSTLSASRLFALHTNGKQFVEERTRYLEYLLKRGWSMNTVHGTAYKIAALASRVDITCKGGVSLAQIEAAADDWMNNAAHNFKRELGPHKARTKFISNARDWLRFINRFREPEQVAGPYSTLIAEYERFLDDERGCSPRSIQQRSWGVCKFLGWYEHQHRTLKDVTVIDVERFLGLPRKRPWSRVTISCVVASLRSFFQFLETRRLCLPNIAKSIDAPRIYTHESLPRGPSWVDVQRLIASINRNEAKDIRDRAIIILLSVYGFRAGEVSKLRLENINWQQERILLTRSKQPDQHLYPLVREAGDAILLYLQKVRPKTDHREIFLRALPPYEPLTPPGVSTIVGIRLKALGLTLPHYGAHSLRHSCATHLVAAGLSLKEIGDHLGHTDPRSTQIYAKVDLKGLMRVAQLELGGLG